MRLLLGSVVYVLFLGVPIFPSHAQSTTPVVFIPGFAGSYLCEIVGGKTRVWPANMDHRKFRLPMDSKLDLTRLDHEACGIVREPIRLGGYRISDVYGKFVEHLRRQLAEDVHVLEFSYDWRLTVEHNARQLSARLDRDLPGKTVDIIAHSFGGLVARYYIQKLGGENRVRHLVTMGTPHRGSVDTFETLYEGWGGGGNLKDKAITKWMGGTAEIRKSLLSFPGFYDMLPNFPNCCWFAEGGTINKQFGPFDAKAWTKFSFYNDAFPNPSERAFLEFQLKRALALHRETMSLPLPGHHRTGQRMIVTGWIDTITRVIIHAQTGERLRFEKKAGDGTVPLYSASDARDTSDNGLHYSPGEHMQIFNGPSAMETVARVIRGGIAPTGGHELQLSISTRDGQRLNLHNLGYEVSPGLVGPGETLRLTVRLTGDARLAKADLSNLTATRGTGAETAQLEFHRQYEPDTEAKGATLVADFRAPQTAGAYVVRINIPGWAEEFKDVFVVAEN